MNNSYAQNREDLYILHYFGSHRGNLLEIGSNDGLTLSNSRLLIEHGWSASLVEPGNEFDKLVSLYGAENHKVKLYPYAIGSKTGTMKFYQSGAHVPNGTDSGLVSTLDKSELYRWPNVEFEEKEVEVKSFADFWAETGHAKFEFISIDAEGFDWAILKQIDLDAIGCKCLVIEWNGNQAVREKIVEYCKGFKLVLVNLENLVLVR